MLSRPMTAKEKWKKVVFLSSIVRAFTDTKSSAPAKWVLPRHRRRNAWETPGASTYLDRVWEHCSTIGKIYDEVKNLVRSKLENR